MTQLRIYDAAAPEAPLLDTTNPGEIASKLRDLGVRFEQWGTRDLPADADQDAVLSAYAPEIGGLKADKGYQSVDVIRMVPDHPEKDALRSKFLSEHRHSEDEVRFFVEGEGLFTLRTDDTVYAMLCEAGDLISVPAGMRHWFDMGPTPRFTAIRLFTNPDGWVAKFTGDTIADRFPRHAPAAA
ncbi:1,2-dihydroxy-3-keto-5-methylthiopentene dioxygenase [Stakelama tenebrarum]|uniref:Acireductone dioxygenase n=1 Tax=Stakelama tenebrarum TaxID=2711215 RepID=A0A6G6Y4Q6_9SPHN|nr:cupin domain-containing protein [Sphingosinithalassobacter tenebrarum]QIG79879.1 cupin domain-containing protein [Sphingosinithalassobacter tenebrarum]